MELKNCKITLLVGQEETVIKFDDGDAVVEFLEIKLTNDQLASALSRLGQTPVLSAKLRGLDKVGKKREHQQLEFRMPPYDYKNRDDIAYNAALKECPEGWEPSKYFGSQGQFFTKDGIKYARCQINRWI